jgi:hypothetical protein
MIIDMAESEMMRTELQIMNWIKMEVCSVPVKLNLSSGSVAENWKKYKQ